ncbi:MAG: hypothetical protein ACTSWV_04890, partial [Candidatus Asgardarchaeia archaeon]
RISFGETFPKTKSGRRLLRSRSTRRSFGLSKPVCQLSAKQTGMVDEEKNMRFGFHPPARGTSADKVKKINV